MIDRKFIGTILLFMAGLGALLIVSGVAKGDEIVLDKDVIVLRSDVSDHSMSELTYRISSSKSDEIMLFITSPGGSISAGMSFIDFMKSSGKKFVCIADYAASMAFSIFQRCDIRYVMESSVLMQHLSGIYVSGDQPNAINFMKFLISMNKKLEKEEAKILNMTYHSYKSMINNDVWMYGKQAVSKNAADEVVSIRCEPALSRSVVTTSQLGMFGVDNLTWSGCPLIRFPLKYNNMEIIQKFDRSKWDTKYIKKINRFGRGHE